MVKYTVDTSEDVRPSWFGDGILCVELGKDLDPKRFESARIIGPVMLHQLEPDQRAVRSVQRLLNGLTATQRKNLKTDLRNKSPFVESVSKQASSQRKETFIKVAKLICAECPLLDDCRDFGLKPDNPKNPKKEIYGGLTFEDRQRIKLAKTVGRRI